MRVVPITDLSKRDAIIDFEKYSINYLREIKQILLLLTNKTPKICLVYFNKLWIYYCRCNPLISLCFFLS